MKLRPNCKINKDKKRLVAKGFLQSPRMDFNEGYELVARL